MAREHARREDVVGLLEVMLDTPSPWGAEAYAAEVVASWLTQRWPKLEVAIDRFEAERANVHLVCGKGERELLVYSHLDTTLTGDPSRDVLLTGDHTPVGWQRSERDVVGLGLAVARGPAAAATIGLVAAARALEAHGIEHRSSLLLAAGGTHRRPPWAPGEPPHRFGAGVRHALSARGVPAAAIIAKSGPRVVLHDEPGAAYIEVELRSSMAPVLTRTHTDAGVVALLPEAVAAVERWRAQYVARPTSGQVGREVAVGAAVAGVPEKCDVLPAVVRLSVYVVLGPGDDPVVLAKDLATAVAEQVAPSGRATVVAEVAAWDPAGQTHPDHAIVRAMRAASREGTRVTGWRGSTDGNVFRANGVPTARWGPSVLADPTDPRRERIGLDDLVSVAGTYAEAVVRFALGGE